MARSCFLKSQLKKEPKLHSEDIKIGINNKKNRPIEFQIKVEKAREVLDLCYDFETGFHYIKQ